MKMARPSTTTPPTGQAENGGALLASDRVEAMFAAIAPRYDLLNHLLSFGRDRSWRRDAIRWAIEVAPRRILDVATGTADLALGLKRALPGAEVIGVDLAEAMLERGRRKAHRVGLELQLVRADGTALPFADDSFDLVTIAYGLRNFPDYQRGLEEFYRVLRPGGTLLVLEFPPPPRGPFGSLFRWYFRRVLPWLGGLISGRPSAYRYLPESTLHFPSPTELVARLHRAGFVAVDYRLQTFGVSALHRGRKPTAADVAVDTGSAATHKAKAIDHKVNAIDASTKGVSR